MFESNKAKRGAILRISDMIDAINMIETYTSGFDLKRFSDDRLTQDAVIRNVEIIGEAAKNIPEEICLKAPSIAWREVKAIRDVIAHNYFGIKIETVWAVVVEEIPILRTALEKLLSDIKKENI